MVSETMARLARHAAAAFLLVYRQTTLEAVHVLPRARPTSNFPFPTPPTHFAFPVNLVPLALRPPLPALSSACPGSLLITMATDSSAEAGETTPTTAPRSPFESGTIEDSKYLSDRNYRDTVDSDSPEDRDFRLDLLERLKHKRAAWELGQLGRQALENDPQQDACQNSPSSDGQMTPVPRQRNAVPRLRTQTNQLTSGGPVTPTTPKTPKEASQRRQGKDLPSTPRQSYKSLNTTSSESSSPSTVLFCPVSSNGNGVPMSASAWLKPSTRSAVHTNGLQSSHHGSASQDDTHEGVPMPLSAPPWVRSFGSATSLPAVVAEPELPESGPYGLEPRTPRHAFASIKERIRETRKSEETQLTEPEGVTPVHAIPNRDATSPTLGRHGENLTIGQAKPYPGPSSQLTTPTLSTPGGRKRVLNFSKCPPTQPPSRPPPPPPCLAPQASGLILRSYQPGPPPSPPKDSEDPFKTELQKARLPTTEATNGPRATADIDDSKLDIGNPGVQLKSAPLPSDTGESIFYSRNTSHAHSKELLRHESKQGSLVLSGSPDEKNTSPEKVSCRLSNSVYGPRSADELTDNQTTAADQKSEWERLPTATGVIENVFPCNGASSSATVPTIQDSKRSFSAPVSPYPKPLSIQKKPSRLPTCCDSHVHQQPNSGVGMRNATIGSTVIDDTLMSPSMGRSRRGMGSLENRSNVEPKNACSPSSIPRLTNKSLQLTQRPSSSTISKRPEFSQTGLQDSIVQKELERSNDKESYHRMPRNEHGSASSATSRVAPALSSVPTSARKQAEGPGANGVAITSQVRVAPSIEKLKDRFESPRTPATKVPPTHPSTESRRKNTFRNIIPIHSIGEYFSDVLVETMTTARPQR
jgi:hypothetical protein